MPTHYTSDSSSPVDAGSARRGQEVQCVGRRGHAVRLQGGHGQGLWDGDQAALKRQGLGGDLGHVLGHGGGGRGDDVGGTGPGRGGLVGQEVGVEDLGPVQREWPADARQELRGDGRAY